MTDLGALALLFNFIMTASVSLLLVGVLSVFIWQAVLIHCQPYYCGIDFADASKCIDECPTKLSGECPPRETCFNDVTCAPEPSTNALQGKVTPATSTSPQVTPSTLPSANPQGANDEDQSTPSPLSVRETTLPAPSGSLFCGTDPQDAAGCAAPCPNAVNADCENGKTCFAEITCRTPSSSPRPQGKGEDEGGGGLSTVEIVGIVLGALASLVTVLEATRRICISRSKANVQESIQTP